MRLSRYGKAPIATLLALFLVTASALPLALMHWDRLQKAGRKLGNGDQAERFFDPQRTGAPLVLAIGDSTMRPPGPFTTQMAVRIGKSVEVRTLWGPGLSPAEAALVASRALELRPDAMILLAHFATFQSAPPLRYPELMRLVPLKRLPDLLPLPFFVRGVGAGEIVLGSVSGAILPASWLQALTGGPEWLDRRLEQRFTVAPGTDLHRLGRFARLREGAILRSAIKAYPGHPSIEMLRGAVRMLERAGTEALVVISPINTAPLSALGVLDAEDIAWRAAYVREVVESEGGDVVDMHDALAPEEFADELGHYTGTGARRISFPVEDWTRRVLGLPPRDK